MRLNRTLFHPIVTAAMIVCVCNRISDRDIARHAHAGMSFDDIQLELGVATVCGSCERCARDLVAQCSASHPACALWQLDASQQVTHRRSTVWLALEARP